MGEETEKKSILRMNGIESSQVVLLFLQPCVTVSKRDSLGEKTVEENVLRMES